MILCVILGFVVKDEIVIWIGGCAQGFVLAGLTTLTLFIVETYTTVVRYVNDSDLLYVVAKFSHFGKYDV